MDTFWARLVSSGFGSKQNSISPRSDHLSGRVEFELGQKNSVFFVWPVPSPDQPSGRIFWLEPNPTRGRVRVGLWYWPVPSLFFVLGRKFWPEPGPRINRVRLGRVLFSSESDQVYRIGLPMIRYTVPIPVFIDGHNFIPGPPKT